MPMEAMSWTKQNAKSIQIALPKETSTYENRIGLTPQAVQLLIANGHEVIVENGAGERAGYSDADYLLAGASVSEDLQQVWQGQLILKINAPTLEEVSSISDFKEPDRVMVGVVAGCVVMVLASSPPVHDSMTATVRLRSASMWPTTLSSVSSSKPQRYRSMTGRISRSMPCRKSWAVAR